MSAIRPILAISLLWSASALAAVDWDPDWTETGAVGIGWGDAATTVGDVNGDGYSDILVGAPDFGGSPYWSKGKVYLYYGSPTGPGSTPDWEFYQNHASAQLGWSIAPAGDMNGDGYADFVVGAPGYSGGHNQEGRIYFFVGSPSGPGWWTQAEINEEDARLGHSLAYAGDVNGDGYDDIIAGAPGWGGFGSPFYIPVQGRAYVYYGGPNGPDNVADWSRAGGDENGDFGWDVAGLGDVNGDGFADVMVGKPMYDPGIIDTNHGAIYCYYGSASGLSTSPNWTQIGAHAGDEFGKEMAFAGDFTGDGFADALIGVPDYNGGAGGVYLASGGPTGLGAAALLSSGPTSSWGGTVSTIGDFNGDGRTDIAVGGGVDDDAYVYLDDLLAGVSKRIVGAGQFATLIASAGDVNGDGLGDFLITDPTELAGAGSVRIYFGGREIRYAVPQWASDDGASGNEYGASIANAGDINGDGIDDLLVGAPGDGNNGSVKVYYGDDFALSSTPDWSIWGTNGPASRFGSSVSSAGDINGDGYDDIVVGDPVRGEIIVYHGSTNGIGTFPDFTHLGPANSEFGHAVAGGGDINGDGFADVLVGAPGFDDLSVNEGLVRVYWGSPWGLSETNFEDKTRGGADARFGSSVVMLGDWNGDGFDDFASSVLWDRGTVWVFLGDPSGVSDSSVGIDGSAPGNQLGYSLAALGDINGDGYADLLAGEPYADTGVVDGGQIRIFFGGTTPFADKLTYDYPGGQFANMNFGRAVAVLGDYDGSGRSLIAVSRESSDGSLTMVAVLEYDASLPAKLVQRSAFEIDYPFEDLQLAGVGDTDGDGTPELGFGLPQYGGGAEGQFRLYGPFGETAPLVPAGQPRACTSAGSPLALRGPLSSGDDLRFHARGWLPIGRTRLSLEWALGVERSPYLTRGFGAWTASATHIAGTPLSADASGPMTLDERYRWRVRVRSTNPFVPTGPWLSDQPNSNSLYGLRVIDSATPAEPAIPDRVLAGAGAFPNPFNPTTQIEFRLASSERVALEIYDVAGRLVRTLHRGELEAGLHRIPWNGMDDRGRSVASGIYHARLQAGGARSNVKLALVK